MAQLSRQKVTKDGLNPTLVAAAAGGDTFENSGRELLYVENGDASSHTVTVTAQKSSFEDEAHGDVDLSDAQVSVPAGEFRLIGPFAPAAFNNASGNAAVSYSSETGMQVAVVQV